MAELLEQLQGWPVWVALTILVIFAITLVANKVPDIIDKWTNLKVENRQSTAKLEELAESRRKGYLKEAQDWADRRAREAEEAIATSKANLTYWTTRASDLQREMHALRDEHRIEIENIGSKLDACENKYRDEKEYFIRREENYKSAIGIMMGFLESSKASTQTKDAWAVTREGFIGLFESIENGNGKK